MTNRAPLIVAIVLLLLPVGYVSSYVALVVPHRRVIYRTDGSETREHYRLRGIAYGCVYWPLEQLDRKLRPAQWDSSHYGSVY